MRRLLEFLLANPILAFVAVAWIAGILGNIAKAAKRRQQQASLPSQQPTAPAPRPADPQPDAEAVAREMRRILGQAERDEQRERERVVRPEPVTTEPVATAFEPPPLPRRTPPSLPSEQRRNRVEPERAPTPVVPTTAARRLPTQIESHVGEKLAQRHVRPTAAPHELGTLGGRAPQTARRRVDARRFALDDLKRAFVLSEILGPPLSSRREREFGQ
ncbi:MAG: hypothetical protein ACK501_09945 [Planctomycetota bacterium]